ncbi:MAG: adenosylmethionine--8-amino-7-oxononanoate transaminase [Carboxydocellales bacterium]
MEDQNLTTMEKDKLYLWHPFTQMKAWEREEQVVIVSGKGIMLIDDKGKEYFDGVSSLWVNVHGHRKKEIDQAIISQLGKIAHSTFLGLTNIPAVELAERLVKLSPDGLTRVFYSDSGSEAVEIALKIAYQYWQQKDTPLPNKRKYLTLTNAYHGDTIGSVSVGGIDLFHSVYKSLLFQTLQVPSPYCYRCAYGLEQTSCAMECIREVEKLMTENHGEIAAMLVEPMVQGAAGMLTFPSGFLKAVRELCTRYNILLIADEVATGFGRTGKLFACEHEGVVPDLLTVAKGITGGYLPLAATLASEEIYLAFYGEYEEMKTFFHGHSYTGNQLACAAALANFQIYEQENLLAKLPAKVELIRAELEHFRELGHVGDIRQCGLMVGLELVLDRKTKEPYPVQDRVGIKVTAAARKLGMIIRPLGNVIVFMPPLASTAIELKTMLYILYQAIARVTGE